MHVRAIGRLLRSTAAIALTALVACGPADQGVTSSASNTSRLPKFNIVVNSNPYVAAGADNGYFHDGWTANNSLRATTEFWDNFSTDNTPAWDGPTNTTCNLGFYASGTMLNGCINDAPGNSFANMPAVGTYTLMWGDAGGVGAGNDPSSFVFNGATAYSINVIAGFHGNSSELGYFTKDAVNCAATNGYCFHVLIASGDNVGGPKPDVPAGGVWGLYIRQGSGFTVPTITGCGGLAGYSCSDATGGFAAAPNQQFALFTNGAVNKFLVGVEDNQLGFMPNNNFFDSDYNDWILEITPKTVINPTGQIGNFVWKDLNGNGVQDSGEPGIAGLTVTLGGAASATTITDANGGYSFNGLAAGNYTVTVATPAGYAASPSTQGGDPLKDSNGSPASVTLATSSSVDLSIDFGFVPPSGQIGDYVWEDENGDGIQDPTEPGMDGITVTLTGPVNATTTTDANGAYLFTGLPAGTYTVTVGTPTGFTPSPSNQGGNPLLDSNGSPATVTLATNLSVNLSIDFGFVPPAGVGRMTGGGQQFDLNGVRISRGLTLHCDIKLSNNLEINWAGTNGTNNFHITRPLTSAQCILDPAYKQPPPKAPFNTFIGVAAGTLNGIPGARAEFTFIDAGEPGKNDMSAIKIYDASNTLVLTVPLGKLAHGNLQAHYDQPHGNKP